MMNKLVPEHLEKHFGTDVDGFVYYWPDGGGSYSAYHLRMIADELDLRNAEWEEIIANDPALNQK